MPVTSVPRSFIDQFALYDEFVVVGHEEPDGDCLGSQLALVSFLERSGKNAVAVSAGPFLRSEVLHLKEKVLDSLPPETKGTRRAAVIVDCSSPERTGSLAPVLESLPRLVIDHHASSAFSGDPASVFIDPSAPSATYLVALVIEALGGVPSPEEARLLLFGLATDTGFFRHVSAGGEHTFLAASRLCAFGADPKEAYAAMYGNKTLSSRRLAGRVMDRARLLSGGKLLVTRLFRADEQELGFGERDSDTMYGQLQNIGGVDAVVFFREESGSEISVGLRSNKILDVGALAASFGGGGHKHAASFRSTLDMDTLEERLTAAIAPVYTRD